MLRASRARRSVDRRLSRRAPGTRPSPCPRWHALAIFAAGLAAGTVNVIVGSGSLITFPTLLALGYPPVLANVSNTVGLVPGNVSGAVAYRRELVGQRRRLVQLGSASVLGGLVGAVLLLGPAPQRVQGGRARPHRPGRGADGRPAPDAAPASSAGATAPAHGGAPLLVGVFLTGIYGGYFGAAQGVILIALLAIFIDDDLQRLNGTKNVLALTANGVAGAVLHRHHPRRLVGGRPHRRRLDHRRPGRRPLRPAPPGRVLRWVIVVVGLGRGRRPGRRVALTPAADRPGHCGSPGTGLTRGR